MRERGYSLGLLSPAQREFASALEAMAQAAARSPTSLSDLIPQLSYDPPDLTPETLELVRQITVPVFGPDDQVALALTIFGYGTPPDGIPQLIDALLAASRGRDQADRRLAHRGRRRIRSRCGGAGGGRVGDGHGGRALPWGDGGGQGPFDIGILGFCFSRRCWGRCRGAGGGSGR